MLTKTVMKEMIYKERFVDIYERFSRKELSCEQACELLHCSAKSFYNKRQQYEVSGISGVLDRRIGKIPHNKISCDKISKILSLRAEYPDYNLQHLHKEISLNHEINESYSSLRRILMMNGAFKIGRKAKKKHRIKRERSPRAGIMIHQDGSTHNWLYGTDKKHDLIITMDDATNEVYSAFLCLEEGSFSSFRGIKDTIDKKGLFHSFYVDRGSHYAFTKKAGGKVDKSTQTQVHRALEQLGITIIHAYSPQARGRSERMFRTWQGRLPQELAINKISSIKDANQYINDIFLPKMNKEFMVTPKISGDDFVPAASARVRETLCVQEERRVNNDNTVSYKNTILQIPENDDYRYLAKAKVKIHDYGNGILEIYHGLKLIAKFCDKQKHNKIILIEIKDYSEIHDNNINTNTKNEVIYDSNIKKAA